MQIIKTDICVVGAGPGGASAALHLSYLGHKCAIVDKAVFPRDKICGDGINGNIPELLKALDPALYERFHQRSDIHIGTWGVRLYAYDSRLLEMPFIRNYNTVYDRPPGYICRRTDFDNFFVEEIKRRDNITLYENTAIEVFEKTSEGYRISNRDKSFQLEAKLLIVANGSDSLFVRHHAHNTIIPAHHAAAIRGYFENVTGFHPDNFVEFYFFDKVIPGYLWIFPHPNGTANVGLGMRTDFISKRKANLKTMLLEVIYQHPVLAERFKNAKLTGDKLLGHAVPLGSVKRKRSGDNYILAGDAAQLVDPLTGGGISNSFLSGKLAAEQAARCLAENNFSASFLKTYDKAIHLQIGKGMRKSYWLQRLLRYRFLVKGVINFVSRRPRLFDYLSRLQMKASPGHKPLSHSQNTGTSQL